MHLRPILASAFIAAAFALTGCGGATTPSAAGNIPAIAALRPQIRLPGAGSMGRLIYVSDAGTNTVSFYTYRGGKLEGSITSGLSEPQGLCSDPKGNVWVANTAESDVVEYAYGATTPKQTLATTGQYPAGCSVDKNGDVAVSDILSTSGGEGNVEIFKGGKGSATSVTCPNLSHYGGVAYDNKGNLFVTGENATDAFGLCEVPNGKTGGEAIRLNTPPESTGNVQWDGTYVAIGDATIERFLIRGTKGSLKRTVTLNGTSSGGMFLLPSRGRVLSFESGEQGIGFFKYPAGGNALKTISIVESEPIGFTVSPMRVL